MTEPPHIRMPPRPRLPRFFHAEQHVSLLYDSRSFIHTIQASFGQQHPLKIVPFADGFHLPDRNTYEHLQPAWAPAGDHNPFEFQLNVEANTQPEHPILLLHVATQHQRRSDPLVQLTLQPHSCLHLLEYHTSSLNPSYFYDTVLRITLQPHSQLHHVRLLRNNREGQYALHTQVYQHNHSTYYLHEISLSGAWRSSKTDVYLEQPNAQCYLQALDTGQRQQCSHHRMTVHHKAPHCSSQQLHKGLYTGHARGVFEGHVSVEKQAVKTKAHQLSRSLLLSEHAQAFTQPQLQIKTDEVQCGHGATVSQLDPKALFYLQSRGIEQYRAHHMLTQAFAQEVLQTVKPAWLRSWLQQRVSKTVTTLTSALA